MQWRAGVLVVVAMAVGCEHPRGLDAAQVCDAYCGCQALLPAQDRECVARCEVQLAGTPIPDACLDCIYDVACAELASCFATCAPPVFDSLGGPP